jgi:hypothetical protein
MKSYHVAGFNVCGTIYRSHACIAYICNMGNQSVIRRIILIFVCRAWQITWWWKSTTGVGSDQPLAESNGVHREGNPKEVTGKVPV